MAVRVYSRDEPNLTNGRYDAANLARIITDDFLGQINGSALPEWTLEIKTMEVKDRAQMHCDKWVEEAGLHFALYASAVRREDKPRLRGRAYARTDRQVMQYKDYSGDVSGVIGESLFSIFLTKQFRLPDDAFAHLRADRSTHIYPDFAIFAPTPELVARLYKSSGPATKPIPAEVKTANYPERSAIKPQLKKAINQIRNYWNRNGPPSEPSIICVAIRNPSNQSYDLGIVWGA